MIRQAIAFRERIYEGVKNVTLGSRALFNIGYLHSELVVWLGKDAPTENTLKAYGNHRDISLLMAVLVELVTGTHELCGLHCRMLGGRFVPDSKPGDEVTTTAQAMREAAEYIATTADAICDGHVTDAEFTNCEEEADQAIQAILNSLESLKRLHTKHTNGVEQAAF